jgi:DNA-binding SARP family transcriptional activator/tRNA A-37 threonylcarbamoyl transferase component Bud32/WD40 repeat protein
MAPHAPVVTNARSEASEYGQDMYFGVLGPIEASERRRRLSVGGPKQRTVLALLIARAGATVSTETLVDGVYGDDPPDGARRSIQTYVSNLRGDLGDVIEAGGSGYVLSVDRSGIDALRFEDAVTEAADVGDPESASDLLREALSLWRGHPYADVDGMFELSAERSRLSELRMSAIELRVDADLERGHHRQLIAELDSLTQEHPLRERFRAQQMLALYRCGRQADALRAYEKTRDYLVDEMGLDPSPDLRDLEQRILEQDPSLVFESGPTVKQVSILVADVADPGKLSTLDPTDRYDVISHQSNAIRAAADENNGDLFAHRGSTIYLVFEDVEHAVSTAVVTQQTLADSDQGMRMAISVGEVEITNEDGVVGPPVTRAARLAAAAHGGQILLSAEANQALAESGGAGWVVRSLGQHNVDGGNESRAIYQLTVDGLERDFPPLRTELLPFTIPTTTTGLPGYELREQVGSGAFGVVHRAYQPSIGRTVAIKIIRPEYVNDPQFIRRFEVEAQLVARLEHPHIVPLHDYWRNPDGAYLVMRWLGGGTLKDEVAQGNLTIDQAHVLLGDIGPALAFAHRRGVVHRDIKLSNVLLDDEGGAYLTDFGIASDAGPQRAGSASQDVQALAGLLAQSIGPTDEKAVADLLAVATTREDCPDVHSFIQAWEHAVGAGDTTSQAVGFTETRNPYKGLSAFEELDSPDFHGRDAEIEEIVATLVDHQMVAVVGPSGIGKSSIVRAGVIPALRNNAIPESDQWLITDMLPGTYPYEELTTALMRVATEMPSDLEEDLRRDPRGLARSVSRYLPENQTVLLVIDQFEELFTLASAEEREEFLSMLAAAIADDRSRVRIVITMRADFFDHPLRFAALGDALRAGTIPISAPNEDSLQSMIVEPAAGVGVAFEAGLVDRIVVDVRNQPGALPLLEFSLTELFEARDSDLITLDSYGESGGVLGALGRRAETIHESLDPAAQDATRETFLRLVNVSDSGRATRRRARLTELERLGFSDVTLSVMLNSFADHRLVTFDRDPTTRGPTVEVAHEAILTEWPRLADWIEDHREDLLLRSRLAVAVTDWETSDRSETYLLAGGRLQQHESWTTDTELSLTDAEEEFLAASRSAEDERRAKRRRTRRLVMSGFGIAAVVALVLAFVALVARNDAQDQAEQAEASEQTARESEALAEENAAAADANAALASSNENMAIAGELSALALDQIGIDPQRGLLLGIESLRRATTPSGLDATHSALFNYYAVWGRHDDSFTPRISPAIGLHPDGKRVLVWEDATISGGQSEVRFALYDATDPTQQPIWKVNLIDGLLVDAWAPVWFDDDSVFINLTDLSTNSALTSSVRGVYVIELETGEVVEKTTFGDCAGNVIPAVPSLGRMSPLIATYTEVDGKGGCVLDGDGPVSMRYFPGGMDSTESIALEFPEPVAFYKFTPHATDDGRLITVGTNYAMLIFDATTGLPVDSYEGDRIAITGDGERLLINKLFLGYAELVDRETGDVLRTFAGEFTRVKFSSDETRFIAPSFDGGVQVFDLESGAEIHDLRGTHNNPFVYLSNDSETLLLGSATDQLLLNLGNRTEVPIPITGIAERLESWGYTGHHAAVSSGGGLIYVPFGDEEGTGYRIFDLEDGSVVRETIDVWRVAAMTPDGRYVAEIPRLSSDVTDPDGDSAELFGPMQLVDTRTGEVILVFDSTCGFYATPPWGAAYLPHEDCRGGQLFLPLTDAEFSADGSRLAVDSIADMPAVFDTTTGDAIWHIVLERPAAVEPHGAVVGFSPDGGVVLYRTTAGVEYWLVAVDIETGAILAENSQLNPNYEIVYSSDGSRFYTANWAGIVEVFDAETFELLDTFTRSQGGGNLDVAVRGNLVATATFDKVVRVQTLDNHELVLEVQLDVKAENLEFLDDNHLLVITLSDEAFVFTMDGAELMEIAKERLTRGFTEEECASFDIDPCRTLEEIKNS